MDQRHRHHPALTNREIQVLALVVSGETYRNIARSLEISTHTVDTYIRRLRGKLGAANRTQLVVMALRRKELPFDIDRAPSDSTFPKARTVSSRPGRI